MCSFDLINSLFVCVAINTSHIGELYANIKQEFTIKYVILYVVLLVITQGRVLFLIPTNHAQGQNAVTCLICSIFSTSKSPNIINVHPLYVINILIVIEGSFYRDFMEVYYAIKVHHTLAFPCDWDVKVYRNVDASDFIDMYHMWPDFGKPTKVFRVIMILSIEATIVLSCWIVATPD